MGNSSTFQGRFKSSNNKNIIEYYCIVPETPPIAIIQFCHGMAEHAKRYEELGRFFANIGIVFCISDHIGHGKSVNSAKELGYFAKKDGWKCLYEDAAQLTKIMQTKYESIPYFIAGHSMGSFVVRAYLEKYSDLVCGAIIIGTGISTPSIKIGTTLAQIVSTIKGDDYKSPLLDKLSFGGYNKQITNVRTKSDWLSTDTKNVDAYIKDPLCGFIFTSSGFRDVSLLLRHVSTKKWADSIKKDLPILLLSGGDDPVGGYGIGVKKVEQLLKTSGVKHVTTKLYKGLRHEILNESSRLDVYNDFASWVCKNAKRFETDEY